MCPNFFSPPQNEETTVLREQIHELQKTLYQQQSQIDGLRKMLHELSTEMKRTQSEPLPYTKLRLCRQDSY